MSTISKPHPHYRVVSDGVIFAIQKRHDLPWFWARLFCLIGGRPFVWLNSYMPPHGFWMNEVRLNNEESARITCDDWNQRESKRHEWRQVYP